MSVDKLDALSHILKGLRLKAEIFVHEDFCGVWAVDTSKSRHIPFHLIGCGHAWLHIQGREPRLLTAGQLIICTHDIKHVISSSQELSEADAMTDAQGSKDNTVTNLLCGYFQFDSKLAWPLLDELDDVITLDVSENSALQEVRLITELIVSELENGMPGAHVIVNELAYILFVHVLRDQFANGLEVGLLAGLFHPQIGRALNAIHANPARDWDLSLLAECSRMSRSSFSEQFKKLMNMTAIEYLSEWRMREATELLLTTKQSVAQIAEASGYRSEVAFRKAFKKIRGFTPGYVRKCRD